MEIVIKNVDNFCSQVSVVINHLIVNSYLTLHL